MYKSSLQPFSLLWNNQGYLPPTPKMKWRPKHASAEPQWSVYAESSWHTTIVAGHLLSPSQKTFFDSNIWIESWPQFHAFLHFWVCMQVLNFTIFWFFSFSVFYSSVFQFYDLLFFSLMPVEPCPSISMDLMVFLDWKAENLKKTENSPVACTLVVFHG